jgi:AhpD family alkylhydroperoxidase
MRITLSSDVPPGLECLDFQHAGPSGQAPDIDAAINALSIALRAFVADDPILNLVAIRVAQLNHCAPSLATHIELAKRQGEHPIRICHVSAWRGSNPFGPRERAAFEWVEIIAMAATSVGPELVDDFTHFAPSSKDISDLSLVVASVNLCSRLRSTLAALDRLGSDMPGSIDTTPWYDTAHPYVR